MSKNIFTDLYGAYDIPSETNEMVALSEGLVYGCPLCYKIDKPHQRDNFECCYYYYNTPLSTFEHLSYETIIPNSEHNTIIDPNAVDTNYNYMVGISQGHAYYYKVSSAINLDEKLVFSYPIQLAMETLSFNDVFITKGRIYVDREYLTYITPAELLFEPRLVKKYNSFIYQINTKPELYEIFRNQYLDDLNPVNTNKALTLDTYVGLQSFKIISDNLDYYQLEKIFEFHKLNSAEASAFGVIYEGKSKNHPETRLLFKYQKASGLETGLWYKEVENNNLINQNLNYNPNLPYPYTFSSYFCNQSTNKLNNLKSPKCLSSGQGKQIGVIVMEEIENSQSLKSYIINNLLSFQYKLSLFLDTLAILAQAHYGEMPHNFMHLDAHTGNFLVSTCGASSLTCRKHNRLTLRTIYGNYYSGRSGLTTYMIDFGLSYFITQGQQVNSSGDFIDQHFNGQIYPAYDFITISRYVLNGIYLYTNLSADERIILYNIILLYTTTTYKNVWGMAKSIITGNPNESWYEPAPLTEAPIEKIDMTGNIDSILSQLVRANSEFGRQKIVQLITYKSLILFNTDSKFKKLLDICLGYYDTGYGIIYRNISQRKLANIPEPLLQKLMIDYKALRNYKLSNIADFIFYVSKINNINHIIPNIYT